MSLPTWDKPDFAIPRGYVRAFSFEIEWIVSAYYDGDGKIVAHLVAPHATTDFFYSIPDWFWQPNKRSIRQKDLITNCLYYNPVFMDYRDLPTTAWTRADPEEGYWSVVIREPDYPIPTNPFQLTLPPIPDYWVYQTP